MDSEGKLSISFKFNHDNIKHLYSAKVSYKFHKYDQIIYTSKKLKTKKLNCILFFPRKVSSLYELRCSFLYKMMARPTKEHNILFIVTYSTSYQHLAFWVIFPAEVRDYPILAKATKV